MGNTNNNSVENGINIIGICINDLDFEGKDSYYYSYYYYQNRYYASHYKSDKPGGEEGKKGSQNRRSPWKQGVQSDRLAKRLLKPQMLFSNS